MKVDRLKDPTTGRFVSKTRAKLEGRQVIRAVRRRGGKVELLRPSKSRKRVQVKGAAALGRSFTGDVRIWGTSDAIKDASERGAQLYVKVGGKVLQVPAERTADTLALFADLKMRLQTTERIVGGGSDPAILKVSVGQHGTLIDLDTLNVGSAEVRAEMGGIPAFEEEARDLSEYIAEAVDNYLGTDIAPEDIAEAWEENNYDENEEPEW